MVRDDVMGGKKKKKKKKKQNQTKKGLLLTRARPASDTCPTDAKTKKQQQPNMGK